MKIIVVSGFLGSGKTTFIKELLLQLKDKKIACVINEINSIRL